MCCACVCALNLIEQHKERVFVQLGRVIARVPGAQLAGERVCLCGGGGGGGGGSRGRGACVTCGQERERERGIPGKLRHTTLYYSDTNVVALFCISFETADQTLSSKRTVDAGMRQRAPHRTFKHQRAVVVVVVIVVVVGDTDTDATTAADRVTRHRVRGCHQHRWLEASTVI